MEVDWKALIMLTWNKLYARSPGEKGVKLMCSN